MSGPGVAVPRSRGEAVRQALAARALLRNDLEVLREGAILIFPVKAGAPEAAEFGELVEREFASRADRGPSDYRELVRLPSELAALLPRSFDVVGDIVLIRLPEPLRAEGQRIGAALLAFVPGARIVGEDRGVHGPERRRSIARIAGSGGWATRHRENGIEIEVDVERAYFSPRLAREHARVADAVERGDRVYDLCCGVGPFTLTIARDGRAAGVTGLDANPEALELLRASLTRLRSKVPVEIVRGDVAAFSAAAPPVERVVLNLPLEGIKYLASVARTVAPRGHLHYYEVVARGELDRRGESIVRDLGDPSRWRPIEQHSVHPYAPSSDLIAFELERLS